MHHLGNIREKIGGDRLPMAVQDFSLVLKLDANYAPAYNGRGLVLDRLGNYQDAIADFSKAVKLDNLNAVYWHNRACCYRNCAM